MLRIILFSSLLILTQCQMLKKEQVELLVKDATVYTVDSSFTVVESFVVKDGKILDTGSSAEMERKYDAKRAISLSGRFVYPGWNDAHCHFAGYAQSLNQVDLAGTGSVDEIIERCRAFAKTSPGGWITGRGWDQNDWEVMQFPDRETLDSVFPDTPVLLRRIDGHAGWANTKALEMAGVDKNSRIDGGDVILKNGAPSGILIDNAIELVARIIPEPGNEEISAGLRRAQENCFAVGLTSVSDAGLSTNMVRLIDTMQTDGRLKMRINAWLEPSESNFKEFIEKGVYQNDRLTIGTLKLYADGALGSRGARMIEPYSDDPDNRGLFVTDTTRLKELSMRALENNYQVAIHCIGDAANHEVLKIYAGLLKEGNDRRWRIEHAQIIAPSDFPLFGKYRIIPSVQSTHATSDMYWAEERLGAERMDGSYAYRTLLNELGWIPNGSDFPVEDINPLYGFYASVARKDHTGYPEGGFLAEESLTREEALRSMTTWAAKAAFEEDFKGSIEKGKLADFVVTAEDIMTTEEINIPGVKVLMTFSGGEMVYSE